MKYIEYTYQKRDYRKSVLSERSVSFTVSFMETDLFVSVDKRSFNREMHGYILNRILFYRNDIEIFASKHPNFYSSLKPIQIDVPMTGIVKEMVNASEKAGTGPMAAVAGAFSQYIGNDLFNHFDIKELMIENGGDIYIKGAKHVTVSIFAGSSVYSEKIALRIPGYSTPLGVCTSSGTVGHSFSFGIADAVVIVCKNTLFADAFATKYANLIKKKSDINRIIEEIQNVDDILSSVIIKDDILGVCGNFELINLKKKNNGQDNCKKKRTV